MKGQSIWLGLRTNKLNGCGGYLRRTGWFKCKLDSANNPNGFSWMKYMNLEETDSPSYAAARFSSRLRRVGFVGSLSCITDEDYAARIPMKVAQWRDTLFISGYGVVDQSGKKREIVPMSGGGGVLV